MSSDTWRGNRGKAGSNGNVWSREKIVSLNIVAAIPDDLDGLLALERGCFPDADWFPRRSWKRLLARPTSVVLVIRDGGRVMAAVVGLLRANSKICRVYSLAVDPSLRGRGVGGALIHALAQHVKPARTDLSLEVRADNPARGLYEKLGFTHISALPGYYPDGADGVRLRTRIADLR